MNKSMYNVVICPDVNYLKYASVLITNIVLNINIAKSYSLAYHGLHFHILCNNFSKEDLKKLASMECDLGRIYPIKITTHVIKNIKFKYYSLPHWINSFAAYYRLIAANFVDQNIEKFLYLDVDTYVNSDIRELFEKSLNGKVLSAMIDINTKTSGVMGSVYRKAKIKGLSDFKFIFPKLNFNTGVLLIDLIQWKKQKIEERCFDFLEKYETFVCDQDSLCAIIGDNFTSLGLEWNFFMGNFLRDENNLHTFKETHQNPMWNYTRKEYLDMKNNIRIVHFTSYALKSWDYYDGYLKNNPDAKFYYLRWWYYARQTPFYEEILFKNITQHSLNIMQSYLQGAVEKVKAHLSYKLGKEILSIKENKLKVFILPFTLIFIYIKHKISNLIFKLILISNPNLKSLPLNHYSDYQEALKIQNYLSYRLGSLLIKHPFSFVFRIARVYREWKKGR